MKKKNAVRFEKGALSSDEAERLFSTVDETGHSNEVRAANQHRRRKEKGQGIDVDPLSSEDPSGSTAERTITRTAISFVLIFLAIVVLAQVSCGVIRRVNTANLSENVNVTTVASALRGGVEWGNGFTQFPEDFTVQEADENTHRIEVTVVDTSSKTALECFAGSQIQATALSVNALLNPDIDTVIYHVNVHLDENGKFRTSEFFDFLKPTGDMTSFMTFIWTKTVTSSGGVRFDCTITGVDDTTAEELKSAISSSSIISNITNNSDSSDSSDSDDGSSSDSTSDTDDTATSAAESNTNTENESAANTEQ
jgi:hypothetical protein